MPKKSLAALMLASLTQISCASGTPPETRVVTVQTQVNVEQAWLSPCGPLPALEGGKLSDALRNHVQTVQAYRECAGRLNALSDAVRAHNDGI
jgi:hypothetical protein